MLLYNTLPALYTLQVELGKCSFIILFLHSTLYRSLYSGVYKLDVEEEPYSCVKKIFPTTTIKPVIPPADKHASLCNFIDLSDNNQGS